MQCEICNRNGRVSFHHYYPKPYRRKWNRKLGIYLHMDEHEFLHRNYTNYELATELNDYDSIYNALNQ